MAGGGVNQQDISHNELCRLYLENIDRSLYRHIQAVILANQSAPDALQKKTPDDFKLFRNLMKKLETALKRKRYSPDYTELYDKFFKIIESPGMVANFQCYFDTDKKNRNPAGYQAVCKFITSVFDNDNKILDNFNHLIDGTLTQRTPGESPGHALKEAYDRKTIWDPERLHDPTEEDEWLTKLRSARNYKPQHTTSLATKRTCQYKTSGAVRTDGSPISTAQEYRFGVQVQREKGENHISPLFPLWIKIQAEKARAQQLAANKITHIYFNLLPDEDTSQAKGLKAKLTSGLIEGPWTRELKALEKDNPNLAVIHLPANSGLMDKSHCNLKAHSKTEDIKAARQELQTFALNNGGGLFISDKIRQLPSLKDADPVNKFVNQSFIAVLGTPLPTTVSEAQKQAVWMYFTHYLLPKQLIDGLAPSGFNFTCKDAIDRGGRASAIYNLFSSFETNQPMQSAEFNHIIHAAALMVKGRGMNDKFLGLWNLIDTYVNTNFATLIGDDKKRWLIEWRNLNCPKEHAERVLQTYIAPVRKALLAPPQATSLADPAASPASANPNSTTTTLGAALRNLELRAGIPPKTASIRLSLATHAVEACLHPDPSIDRQQKAMPLLQSLDNAYAQGSCPTWLYKIKQSFNGLFQSLFHTSNQDRAPAAPVAAPDAPASKNSYTKTVTAFFNTLTLRPANSHPAATATATASR